MPADDPTDIPTAGWRTIARRLPEQLKHDHATLSASGVAFQGFLALVPMLVAAISIYGLIADPDNVVRLIDRVGATMPDEVSALLQRQLESLVAANVGALGFGAVAGMASGLWSASTGVGYLIEGINIAYGADADDRPFWKRRGVAMALTMLLLVFLGLAATLITITAGMSGPAGIAGRVLAWSLVALMLAAVLATFYRHGPDRAEPRWVWVSPGAVFTVVGWLVVSYLFGLYVSNFDTYNETYGSLGAIIVMLVWLFGSAFVVIVGAEVNAEIERQGSGSARAS